ncbi:S1 RNA-binding domain-containing protein [Streptomyces luteireticuli]|uniref:S1 RNA-binding domain-containing protein n=1 Tax=Streptomyces luteireticuli TaxID=173858 RepID=UPI00355807A8
MPEAASDPRLRSLFNRLEPGPVRRAHVIGFDGPDVLVHLEGTEGRNSEVGRIPELEVSMRRIEHPSEILELGQEIEAEEIGRWREGQLHLSARACENRALRSFLIGMRPGQIVSGTVSEVHDFGVFVHLDGEPDGLCTGFIRVPDLSWSRIASPSEAVESGQRIAAKVITSETRQGQVTVSLKALQDDPLVDFASQAGRIISGTITKVLPFGVVVQVAPDVEGLLHMTELTAESTDIPDLHVREGGSIRVQVTEVDHQCHRVSLHAVANDTPN